jgi:diguanylate cyclase (GGDEF)-like protein
MGVAAVGFQILATALIAVLSYVIARAVQRRLMLYWSAGWSAYCLAIVSILAANTFASALYAPLSFLYFFLEYGAVLCIFHACYYIAHARALGRRSWLWLAPSAIVAALLTVTRGQFSVSFAVHGAIVGAGWAACLVALWPALRRAGSGPGVRIVAIGLVLLAIDYAQHLPTALVAMSHGVGDRPSYYTLTSLIDGMLDILLGFGTVVAIIDAVRADLVSANARLMIAHQRNEEALHRDPLTGTLNRYSFLGAFGQKSELARISGAVVVADVNRLKAINDTHGHATGDEAIRAVAKALLSLVRSDDPVYRYGGDEFVIVMIGATKELAEQRMARLPQAIAQASADLASQIGEITASFGVATFDPGTSVLSAVEYADAAMYAAKRG